MTRCPYCAEVDPTDAACFAEGPVGVCTRAPGHDGPHVACGSDHRIDTWHTDRNISGA